MLNHLFDPRVDKVARKKFFDSHVCFSSPVKAKVVLRKFLDSLPYEPQAKKIKVADNLPENNETTANANLSRIGKKSLVSNIDMDPVKDSNTTTVNNEQGVIEYMPPLEEDVDNMLLSNQDLASLLQNDELLLSHCCTEYELKDVEDNNTPAVNVIGDDTQYDDMPSLEE
ncbi:hypothetical protein OCHUTO_0750 [Orientia chuto str. Dubai]|uniref:Uncharacterized protein n=1 Tax=Orientia chuto str. Dubai TaxID=1359168 RepID=A0A0F3MIP8_9RICK|nr:hypothetical protein [Candidatus Orientia mediorientalis]KJV55628.1 hypothetical protein OCHUTO_0750 [Orientia chuto str. Dubai]